MKETMTSLERFLATANREPVDRPACWLGMPTLEAREKLFAEYGVSSFHDLKLAVGDDVYTVEVPYHAPGTDAIYAAFDWYQDGSVDAVNRTLTADGCFKDAEELEDLDFFEWPDPEKYIDREECLRLVQAAPRGKAVLGMMWSAHFQDACASFGMETAFANMLVNPEIYEAVDKKLVDFYLRANEIFYEATKGYLNAVLIGNDIGSQRGLLISPDMVRRFILPGCRQLCEQAHSYGLKVIYHSCGSIADVIPDLIGAGVDVVHPIQALAAGMDAPTLRERFGGKVSFCGGVDTQQLLVHGSPEDVKAKIRELRALFPTGLILSPSHEAIQEDVPAKNVRAMFEAAQEV